MFNRNELLARVYFVMVFFVFLTLWILGKVFYINVIEGDKWRDKLTKNVKLVEVRGDRGNIYAKDGSMLAVETPLFEIRMDLLSPSEKNFKSNIDSLSYYIAKYLNSEKSASQWKRLLTKNRKAGKAGTKRGMKYYLLARNISYEQLMKVKKFPLFRKGRVKGGLIIERKTRRTNPYNQLASRTIGIDRPNNKVGIEGAYDRYLKGEKTKRLMKKLKGGTWIPLQETDDRPLVKGADIVTNIDVRIQDIVHKEVLKKLQDIKSYAGVGIVMEVETGKVVAMTNLSKNSKGFYSERRNYALQGRFAPGSVMKAATTLALLEDGFINKNSLVNIEGGKKNFRGKTIRDDEKIGTGYKVSVRDAFVHSSNVAMAKLADESFNKNNKTAKKFIRKLKSFGLSRKSGIDLLGEVAPFIKDPDLNPKEWNRNTIPWMAHGYEYELTPIQILTFYNAIANGGKMVKPYLVQKIVGDEKTIEKKTEVAIDKIASSYNVKYLQELLKGVVQEGTGQKLKKSKVLVAGKTGTAQDKIDKDGHMRYNSTFVGFFPADEPKYSMIIVMYGNKRPNYYASQVAVPVFKNIVDRLTSFNILNLDDNQVEEDYARAGLPGNALGFTQDFKKVLDYVELPFNVRQDKSWSKVKNNRSNMELDEFQFNSKNIPDVRGMGARDAIYLLEKLGLKVEVEGYGKVVSQSIKPNTRRNKQNIKLILK